MPAGEVAANISANITGGAGGDGGYGGDGGAGETKASLNNAIGGDGGSGGNGGNGGAGILADGFVASIYLTSGTAVAGGKGEEAATAVGVVTAITPTTIIWEMVAMAEMAVSGAQASFSVGRMPIRATLFWALVPVLRVDKVETGDSWIWWLGLQRYNVYEQWQPWSSGKWWPGRLDELCERPARGGRNRRDHSGRRRSRGRYWY